MFHREPAPPPNISVNYITWPFAGPTPGTDDFAQYINSKISINRVFNSLDVVPHAWAVNDLNSLHTIYPSDCVVQNDIVKNLIDAAVNSSKFHDMHGNTNDPYTP